MIAWGLCGRLCGLVQGIVQVGQGLMNSPRPFEAASLAGLAEQAPAQALFKEIACAGRIACCVFKETACAKVVRFFSQCFFQTNIFSQCFFPKTLVFGSPFLRRVLVREENAGTWGQLPPENMLYPLHSSTFGSSS